MYLVIIIESWPHAQSLSQSTKQSLVR